MNNIKKTIIYTDGACTQNGKVSSKGGIGVFFGKNDKRNYSGRLRGHLQTNNRAELSAIIKAIQLLNDDENDVIIYTDSKYCVNAINKWMPKWIKSGWKLSKAKTVIKNKDLFTEFNDLIEYKKQRKVKIEIKWVKGHNNNYGNEIADKLARNGIQK